MLFVVCRAPAATIKNPFCPRTTGDWLTAMTTGCSALPPDPRSWPGQRNLVTTKSPVHRPSHAGYY